MHNMCIFYARSSFLCQIVDLLNSQSSEKIEIIVLLSRRNLMFLKQILGREIKVHGLMSSNAKNVKFPSGDHQTERPSTETPASSSLNKRPWPLSIQP